MSFEVDRYSSAWAHIALCADLTWATEPPDDFIIANQVFPIHQAPDTQCNCNITHPSRLCRTSVAQHIIYEYLQLTQVCYTFSASGHNTAA